jgi:hypothetical protein
MSDIHYTITSTDANDYSTIRTSLIAPPTHMTEFMITGLTTACSFYVLERNDYIRLEIIPKKADPIFAQTVELQYIERVTSITVKRLVEILNSLVEDRIEIIEWSGNRFCIRSREFDFVIQDMSYNMKLVTGLYHEKFPMKSIKIHKVIARENRDTSVYIGITEWVEIAFTDGEEPQVIKYSPKKLYYSLVDDMMILSMMREIIPDLEFQIETNESLLDDEKYLIGKLGIFHRKRHFRIHSISERLQKITGLVLDGVHNVASPLNILISSSAGYYQLTPVLYLTSNVGTTCYSYKDKECINQKILMRINNHFIHGQPIVCNNFEFSSRIPSNALSDVWFRLVDANFQPVKLLNPMYLSAVATGLDERRIEVEWDSK